MITDEIIPSLKENIKMKTTNPFFGTLILVWLYEHWEMFYQLFNFEPNTPSANKISYLLTYLNPYTFTKNLLWCIIISFCVLIVSYMLINLSRYIVNLYDSIITPRVYKYSAPKKIVLLEIYEKEKSLREIVEKSLDDYKNKSEKLLTELDKLNREFEKETARLTNEKDELKKLSLELNEHLEIFAKEDQILHTIINTLEVSNENENFTITGKNVVNMLIQFGIAEEYITLSNLIINDNAFVNRKSCFKYMFLGFYKLNSNNFVELTEYGKAVLNTVKMTKDFDKQLTRIKQVQQQSNHNP